MKQEKVQLNFNVVIVYSDFKLDMKSLRQLAKKMKGEEGGGGYSFMGGESDQGFWFSTKKSSIEFIAAAQAICPKRFKFLLYDEIAGKRCYRKNGQF